MTPTTEQLQKAASDINETIMQKAFVPMFVKLAQAKGVPINTDEDLRTAFNIVSMLEENEATNPAPAHLKSAEARLAQTLGRNPGTPDLVKQAEQDGELRNAFLAAMQLNAIQA